MEVVWNFVRCMDILLYSLVMVMVFFKGFVSFCRVFREVFLLNFEEEVGIFYRFFWDFDERSVFIVWVMLNVLSCIEREFVFLSDSIKVVSLEGS